jgi:hypothetical protein
MKLILGSVGEIPLSPGFNSERTVGTLAILMLTAIYTNLDKICGPKNTAKIKRRGRNRKRILSSSLQHISLKEERIWTKNSNQYASCRIRRMTERRKTPS